jgi:hypothetical protein
LEYLDEVKPETGQYTHGMVAGMIAAFAKQVIENHIAEKQSEPRGDTAEEILDKHLKLMLKDNPEEFVSLEAMKSQPEYSRFIDVMEEYKNTDLRRELKCHAEDCLEMGRCDNPGELCNDCRFYY